MEGVKDTEVGQINLANNPEIENNCFVSQSSNSNRRHSLTTDEIECGLNMSPIEETQKPEDFHPCMVCGDRSSGRHYGILACDGCRGFFKRSVRRNSKYVCRESMKCVVDLKRRNQCQFCRLRKCYQVGMRSEAVQNQRAPRGPGGKSISNKIAAAKFANHSPVTFSPQRSPLNRLTNLKEIVKRRMPSLTPPHTPKQKDNKISISSSAELYDVSVRILYESIAWARNIPTFNELPLSDQALLLENCWNELLLLSIAQWNVPIHLDHLIEIGKSAECGYVSNRPEPKTIKYLQRLLNIIQKFHEIKLDTMEYSCVKAIIVFKPDLEDLKSRSHIEHLQEQAHLTLQDYCPSRTRTRFGKILLKLPLLRELSATFVKKHLLKGRLEILSQENSTGVCYENLIDIFKNKNYHSVKSQEKCYNNLKLNYFLRPESPNESSRCLYKPANLQKTTLNEDIATRKYPYIFRSDENNNFRYQSLDKPLQYVGEGDHKISVEEFLKKNINDSQNIKVRSALYQNSNNGSSVVHFPKESRKRKKSSPIQYKQSNFDIVEIKREALSPSLKEGTENKEGFSNLDSII